MSALMKKNLLLSLTICLTLFYAFNARAQQSCPFVIHVDSATGVDSIICGTENNPCKTIGYGINRAKTAGDTLVRITSGTYPEVVKLVNGISLWGGFSSSWVLIGKTTITGGLSGDGEYYTLKADSILQPTVLSDLIIIAPDVPAAGKSSYGVHVAHSTGLHFQRIKILGGKGGDGTAGSSGTNATISGENGAVGGISAEYSTQCDNFTTGLGGIGGVTTGFPSTAGGRGGRGGYMDKECSFPNYNYDATPGLSGNNAAVSLSGDYGSGGLPGPVCLAGGSGKPGKTVHGSGGAGAATAATLSGLYWVATSGADGSIGENGTGGGGGGGSGGCDDGTDSHGAGGGGGGSGGIASPIAGSGGLSGGHSAALFLFSSTCAFSDCEIILGTGGNGGNGGGSGLGSKGGSGANGGAGIGTGAGGKGGDGGDGGNSGAGGGGAGGSVYGIYGNNSIIKRIDVTFTGGSPGTGGSGGTGIPDTISGNNGTTGSNVNIAGTIVDNAVTVAVKNDPCGVFLSADPIKSQPGAIIFPNPSFDGTIVITGHSTQDASIDIYDLTGRFITGSRISTNQKLMLHLPGKGLFIVRTQFADKSINTQKVWVE